MKLFLWLNQSVFLLLNSESFQRICVLTDGIALILSMADIHLCWCILTMYKEGKNYLLYKCLWTGMTFNIDKFYVKLKKKNPNSRSLQKIFRKGRKCRQERKVYETRRNIKNIAIFSNKAKITL